MRPLRDITMMRMIDAITDKPRWTEKIQDEDIRKKWREEFYDAKDLTDVAGMSESMIKRACLSVPSGTNEPNPPAVC